MASTVWSEPVRAERPELNEQKTTKREEIKKLRRHRWSKFVSDLTLHGYVQFHDARGIRKILWGCILCAMACLIIMTTSEIFSEEKRYEQSIKLNAKVERTIDFPAVMVCNFNPSYTDDLYENFPINVTKAEYVNFYKKVLSNSKADTEMKPSGAQMASVSRILSGLERNNYTSYDEILPLFEVTDKNHIHSPEAKLFVGGCHFKDKACDLDADFQTTFRLSQTAICKRFNFFQAGNPSKTTSGTGKSIIICQLNPLKIFLRNYKKSM